MEELPEVMTYLHDRGVKEYVAFNILFFDEVWTRRALKAAKHFTYRHIGLQQPACIQYFGAFLLC